MSTTSKEPGHGGSGGQEGGHDPAGTPICPTLRLAAAKQSPLVFMVPAMLPGAAVTIVVTPYVELRRLYRSKVHSISVRQVTD
ncbi:hypothetical protein QQX98_000732 [Neonectria punicea]|uniref:Uncharacterized protein n=1 Tax=Neonectria punicea TaxID=979145 RepID=A0ABR1HSD1_9HYPO